MDREVPVARDQQPGRDVGIVVDLGDDDLVARVERPRQGVREQEVDRGRVRAEHDLLFGAAEEVGRGQMRVDEQLVGSGGGHERAADVRVGAHEVVGDCASDGVGRLGAAGTVQVHDRNAVDLACERREAGAAPGDVESLGHGHSLSQTQAKAWATVA